MSARARILFVHHRSELGGAPASLYYFIRDLDRSRFEPHVFCPPGPSAQLFRDAGAIVHTGPVAGFTHIWASVYKGRRWLLFFRELLRLPAHVAAFRRTLRATRFDVVHLNDSPLLPAAFLAHREGIPVIWHVRSALPGDGRDLRSRFICASIRRFAVATVAINRDVARIFDVGATSIPNPIDTDLFVPADARAAREEVGLPVDRPVVSFFGFLYSVKGFEDFIEAAALLRSEGVDATFLVVGGGVRGSAFFHQPLGRLLRVLDLARDYESTARNLVDRLELGDSVRFIPFTRELERLYQASDVVVAPSRGPELGRPVIEAAASGVPVVASGSDDGGGIIVPGETGLLVDRVAPRAIADAVGELLSDGARRERLGHAARAQAEREFSVPVHVARLEQVYLDVLAGASVRVPVVYVGEEAALGPEVEALIGRLEPPYEPHVVDTRTRRSALAAPLRVLRLLRGRPGGLVHLVGRRNAGAAWAARRRRADVVWHVGRSDPSARLSMRALAGVDGVIVADAWLLRGVEAHFPAALVSNFVALEDAGRADRSRTRTRLGFSEGDIVVGLVSGAHSPTPFELRDLARAARLLDQRGVELRFVVPASGSWSRGAPQGVMVAPADVDKVALLAALDIAVIADAAVPQAAVRALAAGCAIVAAAPPSGGILGDVALLVPPRSPAVIAAALARLAGDAGLREELAQRARAAAGRLDAAGSAAEVVRLYQRVRAQ